MTPPLDAAGVHPTQAPPLPRFLQVEPVGQCNLRCQMCPIQFRQDGPPHGPPAFMEFDVFTRLLDAVPRPGGAAAPGAGRADDAPAVLRHGRAGRRARDHGQHEHEPDPVVRPARRACVTSGLAELHVSIDGATAETYERIRVRAHFDQVIRNLDGSWRRAGGWQLAAASAWWSCDAAEPARVPRPRPARRTAWRSTACSSSTSATTSASRACPASTGRCATSSTSRRSTRTARRARECIPRGARSGRASGRRPAPAGARRIATPRAPPRCDWPWRGAYVSYRGLAMPCCMVATPDRINFGNMPKHGVDAIWNGAAYQRFRDQLASDEPSPICRSCSLYRGTF